MTQLTMTHTSSGFDRATTLVPVDGHAGESFQTRLTAKD
jgi:hypothetical protein